MSSVQGSILLVRHGPGRGRIPDYLSQVIDAIESADPELARAIRHYRTGEPEPSLDDIRGVVFWLADPLREWYPECYADGVRIANAARSRGIRIVNGPEALSNSIKSVQEQRWNAAGIPTPRQTRFESRLELEALLGQARFPVLLRGDETHSQEGMRLLQSAECLQQIPDTELRLPGSLAEFVDTREGWRRTAPGTPWARLFHKKRIYVMGEVVRTVHVFFSEDPIVSMSVSTFRCQQRPLQQPLRYMRLLGLHGACLRADYDYWAQETEHADLMIRAARALDLEFVAIDYSDRAEDGPILWEANPYFNLPRWDRNVLARQRRLEERHPGLHAAFVSFLRGMLS